MHKIGYMTPPRGSQDASRTAQDGFCLRFGRQLGAKLEPCWPLFPPKTLPRRLQDDPRCPQKSFGSPKTAQEASKPVLEPSRPRLWAIFDWFLIHFWLIFGWLLIHFSSIFHYISMLKKQAFQQQKTTLWCSDAPSLCCLITCVLGALAGTHLCCALDNL